MNAPSHVRGTTDIPLLEQTIGQTLADAAKRWGKRDAVISVQQDIRWTYAELLERADALAGGLLGLGLQPGDRIGIWSPNCAEWVLTQFAAARAGLVLVTINPAYRLSEVEYTINNVGLRALIAAERFKTSAYAEMIEALAPELAHCAPGQLKSERLPALQAAILIAEDPRQGWLRFGDIVSSSAPAADRLRAAEAQIRPDDAANIQFTSGTTGLPKGATLNHRSILNNGYFVGKAMDLGPNDRICIPVPLYHCFGMVMGNLAAITHGSAMIYPSSAFDPLAVLRTIEQERCTALYGVPTMFIAVLARPEMDGTDTSSLRTGCMAGALCPKPLMEDVVHRLNMPQVTIAYGMTETSPVSFQTVPGDTIDRRTASIGQVQPHLECKIIDENGAIVPRGTAGELCTRGYSVMMGYWNDPVQTGSAIDADGWMHSGDLAVLDEDGYGSIVGRIKDMIIRGGENIYPREIEDYLRRHPAVEDVAVVGVPDEHMGEEVCAWIRPRNGEALDEQGIKAFCQNKIAHYKIPRFVRIVDAFPTTVTGKVQKFMIRQAMVEESGVSPVS
ncbi:AMP-binding protein [Sphingobium sp. ZW T5_29]|uniref:AMP-binding protein n=1 Tax=Sphingobium sp. ZW T5_29 TaxID=3378077 RepID=UPI0038531973